MGDFLQRFFLYWQCIIAFFVVVLFSVLVIFKKFILSFSLIFQGFWYGAFCVSGFDNSCCKIIDCLFYLMKFLNVLNHGIFMGVIFIGYSGDTVFQISSKSFFFLSWWKILKNLKLMLSEWMFNFKFFLGKQSDIYWIAKMEKYCCVF